MATLTPATARAEHPCSTAPLHPDYCSLCDQEGELTCDAGIPSTCEERWDCIDNDGDGLFDCQDNADIEGNPSVNGGCAASTGGCSGWGSWLGVRGSRATCTA